MSTGNPFKKFNFAWEKHRKALTFAAAAVVLLGGVYFFYAGRFVSTDDAFIEGHVIPISPKVSAHIKKVLVGDNQRVRAEEVLVELDADDFNAHYESAKAQRQGAQAELEQAARDVERYTRLSQKDELSKQQLDRAQLRASTARAKVDESAARMRQAELDVSYTRITTPVSGQVAKKSAEPGAYVQAGQGLMAIVSDEKWVIANFKETELTHMRPGQKVSIKVDAYPGVKFKGHVDSIQRGTGARFSLLPPENATGNYVKVVQRIPVKIVFDEVPADRYLLAVGMSAVPVVQT